MSPRCLDVVWSEQPSSLVVGVRQERDSSLILAARHAHPSHGSLERCLTSRVVLHVGYFPLRVVQQARDAKRVAARMLVRIGALEQAREDAEHVFGSDALALG